MIYFDNAATTFPKPERVYKALDYCARNYAVNVGRGQYELSDSATIVVEETRDLLLSFFHTSSSQVVFAPSATIALNEVLRGLDYTKIETIYISPFEHNAVYRTLNYLKKIHNFEIRILQVNKKPFAYDLEKIKKDFNDYNPNLIIISHASNVCGCVAPVEDIFKLGKKYDSINVLDTAQSAGVIDIYYDKWAVDYLVFAGHKCLYGVFGAAGFIMKNSTHLLQPTLSGGSGYDSINEYMPDQMPTRYEAGSLNINAISGLNEALKTLNELGLDSYREKETMLLNYFENFIHENFPEFEVIGENYQGERVAVSSLIHEDYSPDELGLILSKNGFAVRSGMHCSPLAHKFFSTAPSGTVRFSFGIFNTTEEIDSLLKLEEIL